MKKFVLIPIFMFLYLTTPIFSFEINEDELIYMNNGLEIEGNYQDIYFTVDLSNDTEERGIIQMEVNAKIGLELRKYNLKPIEVTNDYSELKIIKPRLMISINVVGSAFNINVGFMRLCIYPFKQNDYVHYYHVNPSFTWIQGVTGTSYDKNYIYESLINLLEIFINDYLSANT